MPSRPKSAFVCQQCGFQSPKWVGRCPSCDGWNTFVEERVVAGSIQTMSSDAIASAAGGVSQLRECTARLLELAKGEDVPIFLVGHVTKEGAVAGPRVLEHIVDAVLYLEGERFHAFRILRATKNRFGSTDEVGVFEMAEPGLREVANPAAVFVGELGLGGELRRVQRIAARLKEAERLGFERAVVPSASLSDLNGTALEVKGVATLREALEHAGVADR